MCRSKKKVFKNILFFKKTPISVEQTLVIYYLPKNKLQKIARILHQRGLRVSFFSKPVRLDLSSQSKAGSSQCKIQRMKYRKIKWSKTQHAL